MNYNNHPWSIGKLTLFIALVMAASVGYTYMSSPSVDAADEAEIASTTADAGIIDKNLMALLDRIEAIELDESIFTDSAFLSLQDYTVTLVPQPAGRNNPFAPFTATSQTAPKTTGGR